MATVTQESVRVNPDGTESPDHISVDIERIEDKMVLTIRSDSKATMVAADEKTTQWIIDTMVMVRTELKYQRWLHTIKNWRASLRNWVVKNG